MKDGNGAACDAPRVVKHGAQSAPVIAPERVFLTRCARFCAGRYRVTMPSSPVHAAPAGRMRGLRARLKPAGKGHQGIKKKVPRKHAPIQTLLYF